MVLITRSSLRTPFCDRFFGSVSDVILHPIRTKEPQWLCGLGSWRELCSYIQEAERNRVLPFVCHSAFPGVVSLLLSRSL